MSNEKATLRDQFAMSHSPSEVEVLGLWKTLDRRRGRSGDIQDAMQEELEFCRSVIKYIHADVMLRQRKGAGLTDADFNAIAQQYTIS